MKNSKLIKQIGFGLLGSVIGVSAIVGSVVPAVMSERNQTNTSAVTTLENHGFSVEVPSSNKLVTVGNINYSLDPQTNQASVVGFSDANNDSDLVIPGFVTSDNQVYVVTQILNGAFYNQNLTSVSLPANLQVIGADAFANNHLSSITLPSSLKVLGNNAFSNNWFKYGTVVNLPDNCIWNKSASLSPFTVNYDLGKFAPVVQFIIQNQAVYEYNNMSGFWQIQSYLPSIAIGQKNNVNTKAHLNKPHPNQVPNQSPTHFHYYQVPIPTNSSIATSRISFSYSYDGPLASLSFINNQLGFSLKKMSNPAMRGYYKNLKGVNFTITSLSQNKTLFSGNLLSQISEYSQISLQPGDVISFNTTPSVGINIYTHVPTTEQAFLNNINQYGVFYQIGNTSTWRTNAQTSFMVTPNGFIPYQNLLHINQNVLNSKSTSPIAVNGVALANHQVTVEVNNTTQVVTSNANGQFSFLVPANTPVNTLVKISCEGCLPTTFKLIGANPIQTGILFSIGKNNFGISPNGYANNFCLWNNKAIMPDYNNPNLNVKSDYVWKGGWNSPLTGELNIQNQIYQNGKLIQTSSQNINLADSSQAKNPVTLNNTLNKIVYNPNATNVVTVSVPHPAKGQSSDIFGAVCDNQMLNVKHVYNSKTNMDEYTFTITNNQMTTDASEPQTGVGLTTGWEATNYMMVGTNGDGRLETNRFSSSWYDPTPLMWETVDNITRNLQTTYQKATALCEWVSQNMHYTTKFCYNVNISDTFNKLEGVCGNYADLLAVLCQMAGMVSRIVAGDALMGGPNYFTKYWLKNHAWVQVWDEQMGEWITLDPTWGWYTPYGQVQSTMNLNRCNEMICVVLWPTGTNYFSYFQGHEYEALNLLGCYFGAQQNIPATTYPASYAVNLTNLLNQAGGLKTNQVISISNNSLNV